jgi:hypothetical protein
MCELYSLLGFTCLPLHVVCVAKLWQFCSLLTHDHYCFACSMFAISESIKNVMGTKLPVDVQGEIEKRFFNRWELVHNDLHAAGYALEPSFINHDIFGMEEVRVFATLLRGLVAMLIHITKSDV